MKLENITKSERLESLDALRGFDMLWISGGGGLIFALQKASEWKFFDWAAHHMEHVEWHGFAFYDMIFPLFLFIAGVSMPFSIQKRLSRGGSRRSIYNHAFRRLFLLILLGLLYNGLLQFDWENMRYASVLGRIGIAWFFATIIVMNANLKWQIIWFWGILIVYWLLMMFVPVPGYGAGVLTVEGSLAGYIDRILVPGRLYLEVHDPEGLFSSIPAISTALMGALTGSFLKHTSKQFTKFRKGITLALAGLAAVGLGMLWDLHFPINKNLWTSSFVLFAGGWSLILLSIFYLIIDVWGFRKWAFFFKVIGLNSITIYMVQWNLINFQTANNFLFGGLIDAFNPPLRAVIASLGYITCMWLFLYILYKKKIFLKV
ncbi:MAG: acyltransferase family protein [Bacteroidota bacterium]